MQFRRTSVASVIAFSILSTGAFAADISPEQLLKKAEIEQTAYLETVRQLVDVDTGTGQAPGLKTISALLVERLKALGAEVTTTPATPSAGDNIVGTIKGSGTRSFLLMVHYDTVLDRVPQRNARSNRTASAPMAQASPMPRAASQ